jgi:hypothetical protein
MELSTEDALRTVFGSLALSASDDDDYSSSFVDEIVRKLKHRGLGPSRTLRFIPGSPGKMSLKCFFRLKRWGV